MKHHMTRATDAPIVVFANPKGGVGKTTLACHYARWLLEAGYARVLLVDLDAKADASRSMRFAPVIAPASMLFETDPIAVGAVREGLTFMPASASLDALERRTVNARRFRAQLESVARSFDAVVIDTPPTRTQRLVAALGAADGVVCPVEYETYAVDAIAAVLLLTAQQQRVNPRLEYLGVVVNRVSAQRIRRPALEGLLASFAGHVLAEQIGMRGAIADSLDLGLPISRLPHRISMPARLELDAVFRRVHARLSDVHETPSRPVESTEG